MAPIHSPTHLAMLTLEAICDAGESNLGQKERILPPVLSLWPLMCFPETNGVWGHIQQYSGATPYSMFRDSSRLSWGKGQIHHKQVQTRETRFNSRQISESLFYLSSPVHCYSSLKLGGRFGFGFFFLVLVFIVLFCFISPGVLRVTPGKLEESSEKSEIEPRSVMCKASTLLIYYLSSPLKHSLNLLEKLSFSLRANLIAVKIILNYKSL